ncbi:hypothetical protein JCM19297_3164 [Nonlabens ulvanivorans]|nr:hypothetical protein [Nonlabens ulvanivorans]GAK88651.1 hypothetical protein JCM19297_3164 [Nonlabens ulvanivorans]
MRLLLLCFLIGIHSSSFAQIGEIDRPNSATDVISYLNGLLDGPYKRNRENTTTTTKGAFSENQRIGTWQITNTGAIGDASVTITYTKPYRAINGTVLLEGKKYDLEPTKTYDLTRDSNDLIPYIYVDDDKDILFSRSDFLYLENNETNKSFFEQNALYDAIRKSVVEDSVKIHADIHFNDEITRNNYLEIASSDSLEILGFKLRVVSYFNSALLMMEHRVIGICPLVKLKSKENAISQGWFYYPDLRIQIAKKLVENESPLDIKHLDDLFFFRKYIGLPYGKNGVKNINESDLNILENLTEIRNNAELREQRLIRMENAGVCYTAYQRFSYEYQLRREEIEKNLLEVEKLEKIRHSNDTLTKK